MKHFSKAVLVLAIAGCAFGQQVAGVVAARQGDEITLETRSPKGVQHTTVVLTAKTTVRRYGPDAVKMADAQPAQWSDIAAGDQALVDGQASADGSRVAADDVVFGTFVTTVGTVTQAPGDAGVMVIQDAVSQAPLTVRLTADTHLKRLPDMAEAQALHAGLNPPATVAEMVAHLPAGSSSDLKSGSWVAVTSTRGASAGRAAAILVIGNLDWMIQMAQQQAPGSNALEALDRAHGGMLGGPGGVNLPAILP